MKTKNVLIVLLVIGIASIGIGCGSSSSGSSGTKVSSGLNSLPPANLTVQSLGQPVTNALDNANTPIPTDVSSITSSTVSSAPNPQMPTLSLLNHMGSAIIKPSSQKNAVLRTLATFKQAQTSGSCGSPVITDNSSPGIVDITITWNQVQCSISSGETLTINGSVSVKGTYNETAGSVNITETYNNLTFVDANTVSNYSIKISLNGSETISGAGIVAGTTNISYSDKGNGTIAGSVTSSQGNTAISGWVSIDDNFTGTPSQLVFAITHGSEMSVGDSKFGEYALGKITMTRGSGSPALITINGSASYGVTGSTTAYSYEGKYSAAYSNIVFDPNICSGFWPSGGTLTITANHVFELDFSINSSGTQCYCANVTVDGQPSSSNPICNLY